MPVLQSIYDWKVANIVITIIIELVGRDVIEF